MLRRTALVLIVSALACGGPETKTGTFHSGLVVGLHYASAKHQGVTDAQGHFTYDVGETVTFSLGGITLGAATGAPQLTPFDLFGVTMPTSEAELAPELRVAGVASPFTKAANVIYLLYALDIDSNPANGIDLTGLDATLTGVRLGFIDNIYTFPNSQYGRLAVRFGLRGPASIPVGAPLQSFYDAMGTAVTFHAVASRSTDSDNNGTPNELDTFDYEAATGMRAHMHQDTDANQVIDVNETYSYDAALRVLSDATVSPLGVGADFTTTNVYSAHGDLTNTDHIVHQSGAITEHDSSTRTYGAAGNVTDTEWIYNNAGSISTESDKSTYNAHGLVATADQTSKAGGTVTRHAVITYTYDDGDLLVSQVIATTQTPAQPTDGTQTTTFVNNADGTVASREDDYDYGADGSIDQKRVATSTYDESGRMTSQVTEVHDGTGKLLSRLDETITLDSDGNILSDVRVRDTDGDGQPNSGTSSAFTYDASGNRVTSVTRADANGDGNADSITTVTSTFDANSNATSVRSDSDSNADGTIDATSVTTSTYTAVAGDIRAAMARFSLGE